MSDSKTLFIIAGEPSGDMHGAALIRSLKDKDPNIRIVGLGGAKMKEAGCELLYNMMPLAVVGFVEVLRHYVVFRHLLGQTVKWLKEYNPDTLIFIDYPGFNMRVAKIAKLMKIRMVYYISPQIWAWRESRLIQIKQFMDKVLVILPFEEEFYRTRGYDRAVFVGHPLLDRKEFQDVPLRSFPAYSKQIGLLPGSRVKEIQKNLPEMLKSTRFFPKEFSFVIPAVNDSCQLEIENVMNQEGIHVKVVTSAYDVMKQSAAVIVAAGTAVLECACLGVPMVIVYTTTWITWAMSKFLLKIKHIGIVNILAKKIIVPEMIQGRAKAEDMAHNVLAIVQDRDTYERMIADMNDVKKQLGPPGANVRAAREVLYEF